MLTIDNILVPRDFSSVSDRAVRNGLDLAGRTGATLHVLYAQVLHGELPPAHKDPTPAEGVDAFREEVAATGTVSATAIENIPVVDAVRRDVSAASAILDYAAEEDIDLITLGTHGRRGPSRILLGSVAEEVVRRAKCPVLTVRGPEEDQERSTIERILVPVDFSEHSREALRYARAWAELYDADIDVLHVIEETLHPAFYVGGVQSIYDAEPKIEQKVLEQLETFVDNVVGSPDAADVHVRPGTAPSTIADFAQEEEVDLVSMSTHGRTGLKRFLMGSVAEKVVRHVACPVLTVKAFGRSILESSAPKEEGASKG